MDLRQLEILRAVAQTGSFTSAGQQLHLSQSAVSRQILLLEEELKEQLFLRLGRKIRITPAGTTLLGLSERMFEDLEDVRLYDEGKAALQRGESEVVPLEQAMREIREGKVTGD